LELIIKLDKNKIDKNKNQMNYNNKAIKYIKDTITIKNIEVPIIRNIVNNEQQIK